MTSACLSSEQFLCHFLILISEHEGIAIHRLETEKSSWIFQYELQK